MVIIAPCWTSDTLQLLRRVTSPLSLGCSEMLMAKVVSDLANRTPGKEAVAMESFAKALRMVRVWAWPHVCSTVWT